MCIALQDGSDVSDASVSSSGEERDTASKILYRNFSDWESDKREKSYSGEAAEGDEADAHCGYIAAKIRDFTKWRLWIRCYC